jgi:transposase-like protein
MATVTNKRKVLSFKQKVKLIRAIENGRKKSDVCQEFSVINSTIKKILKNRTKIIGAFKQNSSRIKRPRKPERSDDEALHKSFKQQRRSSVSFSVLLLVIIIVLLKF